jgi:hypothetical protein
MVKKGRRNGSVMMAAILVAVVLLIFSQIFIMVGISQKNATELFSRRVKAFYLADAGLDNTISWLRSQGTPPAGNSTTPWNNGTAQSLGAGIYNVSIIDLGLFGSGGVRRYKVTSVGTVQNVSRSLTNYVQVDNYARYLWFTDQESYQGSSVWFWSQDHLNGPTQTNGHFNIYGNPTFDGEADSVDDYIQFYNNGHSINSGNTTNPPYDTPNFNGGMNFGAAPTTMPKQAQALRSAAASGGLYLTGNTVITLNSNSTMTVTNSNKSWSNQNMALPANSALFVNNGTLTVSGVLNGRVTMGSSQDLIIPNNITYAHDPRTNSTSTDTMGLISEKDVVIDDGGPKNLEIDSCIMSMGKSFYLDNWDTVAAKGNLTVYGGIIQDERGPVGTFNADDGTKKSGYSKNYLYDSRLLASPPAFMPTTGDYVTLSWQEN